MTAPNGIERRSSSERRKEMTEVCKDCPIEGFKVVKKIVYLILAIVLGTGTFNTLVIRSTNEALAKNELNDAVQHEVSKIQIGINKEDISEIMIGFKEQSNSFNALEKSIIEYHSRK